MDLLQNNSSASIKFLLSYVWLSCLLVSVFYDATIAISSMNIVVKLDKFIITDETVDCNWCKAQHSRLISVFFLQLLFFLFLRPICCNLKLENETR